MQNASPAHPEQDRMVALTSRRRLLSFGLAALAACGGDSTGPTSGSLAVTILGLPNGSTAAVIVTGPAGYSQAIPTTQTLTPLTPGTYTVTASDVTVGPTTYTGNPTTQTVSVGAAATASVTYGATAGTRLLVNVNGLPSSTPASITVTGPGGFAQTLTGTQTLGGLTAGTYTIAASGVSSGTSAYTPSPASQDVNVVTNGTSTSTVTYVPPSGGTLNLSVAAMYLTQSVQTLNGTVPLVQNRDGYLRVFVLADGANLATASVRVRLYQDLVQVSEQTISRAVIGIPTSVDESSLSNSWNVTIPGSLIRPGLSILAEVDPENTVAETNESENAFPAAAPQTLWVRAVPAVNLTLIPVTQKGNGRTATITSPAGFVDAVHRIHPLSSINTLVHAPYTTVTADTLEDDNGNSAWGTILGEIDVLRAVEGSSRYYYGVAKVSYGSGVAGVAYVSTSASTERAALGWDYLPSGSVVAAHELAHNWGRNHAPCGNPAGVDTQYPHSDGSTGVFGLDMSTLTLKPPSFGDVMGYCDPKWIGDYTYKAVFDYLSPPAPVVMSATVSNEVQPTLVLWGHIRNGRMVLEPAFRLTTRPRLPSASGPYSIVAKASDGATLLNLSFTGDEVADAPGNHRNFVFAVPLPVSTADRISSLELRGPGGQATLSASALNNSSPAQLNTAAQQDFVAMRRTGGSRVELRWNARSTPMIMVRDPDTGEVLSLARGGHAELATLKGQADLLLSDGVKSRQTRVSIE